MRKKLFISTLALSVFLSLGLVSKAEETQPTIKPTEIIETIKPTEVIESTEVKPTETIVETTKPTESVTGTIKPTESITETTKPTETIAPTESTSVEVPIVPSDDALPPSDETPIEDVTIKDKVDDFIDKWLPIILNAVGGAGGALAVAFMALKLLLNFKIQIKNGIDLNANLSNQIKSLYENSVLSNNAEIGKLVDIVTNKVSDMIGDNDNIMAKMQELFNNSSARLETEVTKMVEVLPQMTKEFNEIKNQFLEEHSALKTLVTSQSATIQQMKELIALLITSNPTLAQNGLATKIIEAASDNNYLAIKNNTEVSIDAKIKKD